ncbi:MAG: hypothetical protein C0395_07950 [Gemmatimonas sp.]|nr:hypothetical protein [Gemmatimonas sp.]
MSLRFSAGVLTDTLDRTLGQPAGYEPAPEGPAWDPPAASDKTWRIPLLNDAGSEVGVVVADLHTVVLLGGSLIMLPESSMREQVAEGSPSPPVLEAFAEVVNVLRGVVNNTNRNPHTVPGPLATGGAGPGWSDDPKLRLDLVADSPIGPARLSFRSC